MIHNVQVRGKGGTYIVPTKAPTLYEAKLIVVKERCLKASQVIDEGAWR